MILDFFLISKGTPANVSQHFGKISRKKNSRVYHELRKIPRGFLISPGVLPETSSERRLQRHVNLLILSGDYFGISPKISAEFSRTFLLKILQRLSQLSLRDFPCKNSWRLFRIPPQAFLRICPKNPCKIFHSGFPEIVFGTSSEVSAGDFPGYLVKVSLGGCPAFVSVFLLIFLSKYLPTPGFLQELLLEEVTPWFQEKLLQGYIRRFRRSFSWRSSRDSCRVFSVIYSRFQALVHVFRDFHWKSLNDFSR